MNFVRFNVKEFRGLTCVEETLEHLAITATSKRSEKGNIQTFFQIYKQDPKFSDFIKEQLKDKEEQELFKKLFQKLLVFGLMSKTPPLYKKIASRLLEQYHQISNQELQNLPKHSSTITLTNFSNAAPVQSLINKTVQSELLEYERRVAALSPGDKVVFSETSFILDEFLGHGNATHIWAVEGEPDKALRLPFLTNFTRQESSSPEHIEELKSSIRNMEKVFRHLPHGVPCVTIHSVGNYFEYALVDRVDGSIDGSTFLNKYGNLIDQLMPYQQEIQRYLSKNMELSKKAEQKISKLLKKHERDSNEILDLKKLSHLFDQHERLIHLYDKALIYSVDIDFDQFVWSEARSDWILIDYGGLDS